MTQTVKEEIRLAQYLYRKDGDTGLSVKEKNLLTSIISKYGTWVLTKEVH